MLTGVGEEPQESVKTEEEIAKEAAEKLAAEAVDDGSRCEAKRHTLLCITFSPAAKLPLAEAAVVS